MHIVATDEQTNKLELVTRFEHTVISLGQVMLTRANKDTQIDAGKSETSGKR